MLNDWIKQNGPNGELKLAEISRVSYHTIHTVRTGYVPRKDLTRVALSTAMSVDVDELFPLVGAGGIQRAS